jgi:hypothetical protein
MMGAGAAKTNGHVRGQITDRPSGSDIEPPQTGESGWGAMDQMPLGGDFLSDLRSNARGDYVQFVARCDQPARELDQVVLQPARMEELMVNEPYLHAD